MVDLCYPVNVNSGGENMDGKRTNKTGSQRVKDWRLRHLREFYRTEVLLDKDDAAKLDTLCSQTGLDRSAMIRELIRNARFVPG